MIRITLLTETQVSQVTGFKIATLRKRRWQGLPPRFMKVGSKVFYSEQDIQEFLDSCRRTSTSDTGGDYRG
jgi:hypothetical protein